MKARFFSSFQLDFLKDMDVFPHHLCLLASHCHTSIQGTSPESSVPLHLQAQQEIPTLLSVGVTHFPFLDLVCDLGVHCYGDFI